MEMTFQHVCDPCEYLLFDNVCMPEELNKCLLEAKLIEPAFKGPKETGSAKTEDNKFKKQNNGVFLNEIYTPNFAFYSPVTIALHKVITITKSRAYTALSQLNHIKHVSGYDVLLSAYKNGDYYLNHQDTSVLTCLFWFGESDNKGGDLLFTAFNHVVPFAPNKAIIFPSYYEHEITKIETNKKEYVRFSATAFLVVDGTKQFEQPSTVGTNDF